MTGERRTGWEGADRWFASDASGGAGDGGGQPPEPAEEPTPQPRCEVCGSPLEPDQTYCLECGSPTPLAPRLHRGGRMAAILAGAMVVLGLGAGALAYAVVNDHGTTASTTGGATTVATTTSTAVPPPATGPLPPDTSVTTPTAPATSGSVGTTTGFDTVTGPTTAPSTTEPSTTTTEPSTTQPSTTEPSTTEPSTTEPSTTAPSTGASDWPTGTTAWTAVLSSLRSESAARAAKSKVRAAGEPAGVLFSSDHPGLRAGYWVVFSGTYSSQPPAAAQAQKLRPKFPGAYARRIQG